MLHIRLHSQTIFDLNQATQGHTAMNQPRQSHIAKDQATQSRASKKKKRKEKKYNYIIRRRAIQFLGKRYWRQRTKQTNRNQYETVTNTYIHTDDNSRLQLLGLRFHPVSQVVLALPWKHFQCCLMAPSRKVVEYFLFLHLSPAGDQWCNVLGWLQEVSQAPQHFRSSETQATCFACHSVCVFTSIHSGMSPRGKFESRCRPFPCANLGFLIFTDHFLKKAH